MHTKATLLNVVPHIDPKYGGIVSSIPPLCEAMASNGRYVPSVAAFCSPGEHDPAPGTRSYDVSSFPLGRLRWTVDRTLRKSLTVLLGNASVVHVHGIWQEHCELAATVCDGLGKPLILSAHGMLDSWALQKKGWKKKLYLALRHKGHLQTAACLRALTVVEAEDYRRIGLTAPIAVIPNGVKVPEPPQPQLFRERFPELRDKSILLFLGRLHPKKGVLLLAETWGRMCRRFPNAHLIFAGPDDENTAQVLAETIQRLDCSSQTSIIGMLSGALKWSAYSAARAFVLASYSEGFSMAALEAMAAGCPVILSQECHFPEIVQQRCGWLIESKAAPLEAAITDCLGLQQAAIEQLGANGRELAARRYDWNRISEQMADVCDWLRGGQLPRSVELLLPNKSAIACQLALPKEQS